MKFKLKIKINKISTKYLKKRTKQGPMRPAGYSAAWSDKKYYDTRDEPNFKIHDDEKYYLVRFNCNFSKYKRIGNIKFNDSFISHVGKNNFLYISHHNGGLIFKEKKVAIEFILSLKKIIKVVNTKRISINANIFNCEYFSKRSYYFFGKAPEKYSIVWD